MAEQQQQGDIAHHPVHLLAKDGGAAQGLEESPERPPRARSPGRLLALVLARALLLRAAGLALTLALTCNPPAVQACPKLMLRQTGVQVATRACKTQLPEGLICPMRDNVSPSHALSCHTVLTVSVPQRYTVLHKLSWDAVCGNCAATVYAAAGVNTRPAALGRSRMPCAERTMVIARMGSSQSPSQGHARTVDRYDEMVSAGCHIAQHSRERPVRRPKVKRRTSRQAPTCTSYCLLRSREALDDAQVLPGPASVSTRDMHRIS